MTSQQTTTLDRPATVWLTERFGNCGLGKARTARGALRLLRREMGPDVTSVRFGWERDPRDQASAGAVNRHGWFAE